MKKFKNLISLLMCVVLVTSTINVTVALDSKQNSSDAVLKDEKVVCKATIDEDFADDKVIVVLDKSISAVNKVHDRKTFGSVDVKNITDLTALSNYKVQNDEASRGEDNKSEFQLASTALLNEDNFRQIISLELPVKSKSNVLKVIKQLEQLDGIVYAGPSYYYELESVTNSNSSSSSSVDLWGLNKIQAQQAWNITKGSAEVRVGVMDTGIAVHDNLNANVVAGWDFHYDDEITTDDTRGHGTHIAGTIGADGVGGLGITGVTWNVKIVPMQIADPEDEYRAQSNVVIAAITYAINNDIRILNYSYGAQSDNINYAMRQAISNYRGLFVCAAGNNQSNNDQIYYHPANYNLPNMISVANTTSADILNDTLIDLDDNSPAGSNYGATTVHLAAPGTDIYSTLPESVNANEYDYWSGTSMAAPHVTGVAALILSIRPDLSTAEVKKLILDNVDHVEALEGKCITEGRLNAYKAVLAATQHQTLTGDVNGDNRADMILSRNINGKRALTVFLGKADGSFTEPLTTQSTRNFVYSDPAFAGDFDGDGYTDVVIHWRNGTHYMRRFLVYRSKGDGTFYDAVQLSCTLTHEPQQYPCTFHVDDVDGDGQDDFIIVQKNSSGNYGALVYRGTSQSPYLIDTSTYAVSSTKAYSTANTVHTGDFNGDGRADILVQRSSPPGENYKVGDYFVGKRQLIVYLGNTNGTFNEGSMLTSVRAYDLATYPSQFFVSDMNGDGRDDFVVHWKNDSGKRTNIVYKGASYASYLVDSSTNALATFHTYSEKNPVFVGDINGDGREDMLFHWSSEGKRQLWVYPANADGTYSYGENTATINACDPALYADEYFVEDVNGDGREDFIVKWKKSDGRVCFLTYLGTASGTFSAAVRTEPTTYIPYYNSNTYRITNVSALKCLDISGNNVTSLYNNQNVCIGTNSGTLDQKWIISFFGNGTYIKSAVNTAFGLNVYRTGDTWNCDLFELSGNETDAQVDFIATSGGAYRIKLHNYDLYLTASSTEEGANVYWTSFISSDRQTWYVTPI